MKENKKTVLNEQLLLIDDEKSKVSLNGNEGSE